MNAMLSPKQPNKGNIWQRDPLWSFYLLRTVWFFHSETEESTDKKNPFEWHSIQSEDIVQVVSGVFKPFFRVCKKNGKKII